MKKKPIDIDVKGKKDIDITLPKPVGKITPTKPTVQTETNLSTTPSTSKKPLTTPKLGDFPNTKLPKSKNYC